MSEDAIRAAAAAERWSEATTLAVRLYGDELLGYLVAMTRNEVDAGDAFAIACEQLWRALPRFRWDCSLRTLCYALARQSLGRVRRDPHRKRAVALSDADVSAAVAEVRSPTPPFMRTAVKDKVAELRAQLAPDDQTLLILRVNRGLQWREIARALSDDDQPTAEALTRAAAALRKRFERLKQELKAKAQAG